MPDFDPFAPTSIAAGIAILLVVLFLLFKLLRSGKSARTIQSTTAPAELPTETAPAALKVELPPSEREAELRADADAARAQAQVARQQRGQIALEGGDASQQATLKEQEEEAKRAAYRAEKAAEQEAKERRKREVAEAARLEAERRELLAKQEAERKAAEEAAEKARIDAQAGQTLAQGLQKTRSEGFMAKLNGLFGGAPRPLDEKVLAELEEVLFTADIGVKTAESLVGAAREKMKRNETNFEGLKGLIRREVERIVDLKAKHDLAGAEAPYVIMVVGVNGSGKTTTIGKLAAKATSQGKKVVLAAGDTFRAAAAEQLDVWAERANAELVKGKEDSDPASVIFEAVKKARETGADLVIADTAGRLHTKLNLMEELKKVRRVIGKAMPGAPHEVLLVLDSTNGQNAIAQAKQFHDAVGLTGIVLTKLDGTAKGGVIIGICDELKVPVAWAGVGEKVADLRAFEPKEFVQALFD